MDDSDLDTNQILHVNEPRANYNTMGDPNEGGGDLQETTASTASLTPALFKKDDLFQSKTKLMVVAILFSLNLLNYIDRFTIAGK